MKKHKKGKNKSPWVIICWVIIVIIILSVSVRLFINQNPFATNQYTNDWPTANQDYANTRSAVHASITSKNISNLGLAWTLPIVGISEWGAATTNPVILGNTVYFQDLKSNVYAVDLATGKRLWIKQYNMDNGGPNGVAVGYGKIFAVKGHYAVAALDTQGKELWSVTLPTNNNVGIDIQPTVYNNKVYISTVPGVSNENFYKGGSVGVIYALDQQTGKIIWSFDTVDSKDIWGNPQVNNGGGAWYPPAIDTKSQTMFWGIGNAAPWPGTKDFPNGTSRPGRNLYTSSIVALNTDTGKLIWYNQVAPHDLFDYDFQISPILTTITRNGKQQEIVIGAGKMGRVVAFDRATGMMLWNTPVGVHKNDDLQELPPGTTDIAPGPIGGVETLLAYADGVMYVPIVDMTVQYTPTEFVSKSFNFGTAKGELVAIDVTNGNILWKTLFDSLNVGGATVVNDLVFTATYNGKIYAIERATGKTVWTYQAPGGINGWPAVKDDTIIFPVGLGNTPSLLAFKIGKTTQGLTITTIPPGGSGKSFQQ